MGLKSVFLSLFFIFNSAAAQTPVLNPYGDGVEWTVETWIEYYRENIHNLLQEFKHIASSQNKSSVVL